jgi:hypothetical protein
MLERLIKWIAAAEIGHLGRMFLLGMFFLAVGLSIFYGIGVGFITFGLGIIIYCLFRGIEEIA